MHAFVLRQSRPRNLLLAALSCGLASCDANTAPDGDHPQQDNTATGSTTDPTSMLPDCTTPTDLASAMADLNNARPCWPWLDEQAAQLPRKALPPFWRTIYFDPSRFSGDIPADHTPETKAFNDNLLATYPWINFSPLPPTAPPWATETTEIRWPYAPEFIDDKMRGIATTMLYARSLGLVTRISTMLPHGWEDAIEIADAAAFRSWVEQVVVPQTIVLAQTSERIHAEAMGTLSVEIDHFVPSFPALRSLSTEEQLQLSQFLLDTLADAVRPHFSGQLVAGATALWLDDGTEPQPDWTQLRYDKYDELGFTLKVNCVDETGSDKADLVPTSLQLERVRTVIDQHPTLPWSLAELFPPYAICESQREASFIAFTQALDTMSPAPIGLGMDIAPMNTPNVNLDQDSLAFMSMWLANK